MKRLTILLFVISFVACDNWNIFSPDASNTKDASKGKTPEGSPTPTPPKPGATATPDNPCDPTVAKLKFYDADDEKDATIVSGAKRQLDFSPYHGGVKIADSCNDKRHPVWSIQTVKVNSSSPSECALTGTTDSYTPTLHATTRVGDRCIVTGILTAIVAGENKDFKAVFEVEIR